ncbi:MAG: diacylglycerol kinase [Ferrovum sp.]|nr:diacylglycerol kinase [Ferrovum sp.]
MSHESSFRWQLLGTAIAEATLWWMKPPLLWILLTNLVVILILAMEAMNTALEHALDGLHPTQAKFVKISKDCAAAAVLLLSLFSLFLYGALWVAYWRQVWF